MTRADAERWAQGLEAVMGRIGARFGRVEPRRRARAYVRGLLSAVERKNGWQLAEAAGDRTPDGVQDFLARAHWEAELVRDDLRTYVVEHLGDGQAVLVLDETGFLKKGDKSCGVQRQYSGTAGRIENCQIGVFLAYASRHGHALLDRALYLPENWAHDPPRRAAAGVPATVVFATKPKLGRAMLKRAFAAGVPCAWVVGDSVYGADYALRRVIEQHGRGYVMMVTSAQRLGFKPVADWLEDVPARAWRRLSAGDGAKGPRLYDWAYLPYRSDTAPGWQKGLLIRRKIKKPAEFTFYLTLAPVGTTLAELVRVAGTRWTVEACFEAAKGEVGLDQYEVRSWTGWHRHITLAMLAHAYLAVLRQTAVGKKIRRGSPNRARFAAGAAAAHGARAAPAAVASGVGAPA
jgi:SRSO17 transposase